MIRYHVFAISIAVFFCPALPSVVADDSAKAILQLLDSNRDGVINPYEAFDRLLQLEQEPAGAGFSYSAIEQIAVGIRDAEIEEVSELFGEFDSDGNERLTEEEIPDELIDFVQNLDANSDGEISLAEARDFSISSILMSQEQIASEVNAIFEHFDSDSNGSITAVESDSDRELLELISEADSNSDRQLSRQELTDFLVNENTPARFEVDGDVAMMNGVINSNTPAAVLQLIHEHPEIGTIQMENVPGSVDDEANLRASRYVRKFGFNTLITADSSIASGGTDFFLAGRNRSVEHGARIGIHSWGGVGVSGAEVPRNDPQHRLYLDYYEEMGIPAEFYWRTLEAAPVSGIHWMTEDEIQRFGVRSGKQSAGESDDRTEDGQNSIEIPEGDVSGLMKTKIHSVPDSFPATYRRSFDRYTQIIAPNGKPISIFAQPEITEAQIRHVRDVMLHFLTDFPGSDFGSDKGRVADRMADNGAMMMILRGSDGDDREPRIHAQPLFATETIVEGTAAYVNNDFEDHRDATLEEVLHCVHDFGIGVDVSGAPVGVLPEFQSGIRSATSYAMENGIWPTEQMARETRDWIDELRDEGSLTQEYLASVIDSYYGLWGPFHEDNGMWGIYAAKTRDDIAENDPRGLAVVQQFFHPVLTYTAEIDPSFEGTFFLSFDEAIAYTHKSQYLANARLTGHHHSNLTGNSLDNTLGGNEGDNVINGGDGTDTVVFPQPESEYTVTTNSDGTISVTGDGSDTLVNIERLEFDGLKGEAELYTRAVNPFQN
ncbi:MAG: hypothetical protein AAF456_19140 [Planctomycetota bacterium]